jgi:hypothetical protein
MGSKHAAIITFADHRHLLGRWRGSWICAAPARDEAVLQTIEVPSRLHSAVRALDRRRPQRWVLHMQCDGVHRKGLREEANPAYLRDGLVYGSVVVELVGRLFQQCSGENHFVRPTRSGDADSSSFTSIPLERPIAVLHIDADYPSEVLRQAIQKYSAFLVKAVLSSLMISASTIVA